MHQEDSDQARQSEGSRERSLQLPADGVRVGDTVIYTSKFDAEYRFTIASVDPDWLTFETGQMVHKNRFERESFEVVRTPAAKSTTREPSDEVAGAAAGEQRPQGQRDSEARTEEHRSISKTN